MLKKDVYLMFVLQQNVKNTAGLDDSCVKSGSLTTENTVCGLTSVCG